MTSAFSCISNERLMCLFIVHVYDRWITIVYPTYPTSHIQNQHLTSEIRQPTSDIRHPTSGIQCLTSEIRYPTSEIRQPTFEIRHSTFDIRHTTSDIRHTTSDIWKYGQDVQCLGSSDLQGEVWKETMRTILVFFYVSIILHCCECVLPAGMLLLIR